MVIHCNRRGARITELFESEVLNISRIVTVKCYGDEHKKAGGDGWIHYSSVLKTYELIFFLSGSGDCVFDGGRLEDRPGTIRYLPKGRIRGEYLYHPLGPSCCIDIYFDTDEPMPPKAAVFTGADHLREDFTRIYSVWTRNRTGYYAESMSLFYKLISAFRAYRASYADSGARACMLPAYEYLKTHCTEKSFDYLALCSVTGLSYSAFSENFKKVYHVSPVRMVTRLRIEKACEMLATGHYSVTETAEACGFENVYYFSNVFKKIMGVPPREYRP